MKRGLILAVIQVVLVLTVTAQFLYDRATLPRVWTRSVPLDPYMPIRGRYVSLRLKVEAQCSSQFSPVPGWALSIENGQLTARRTEKGRHHVWAFQGDCVLGEAVPFFIPPQIPDPSRREPGEELWVEVSVPKNGPPRPIQLAVKKDGKLQPLNIR
ncbi:MAG: hypothetical protein JNL98_18105 [Bryobacterales bacterium]|nr:hypothetical protein [Bryobacterales bacterium]